MSAIIKAKTKQLKNGKIKTVIDIDRELTELTQSDKIKIEMYLSNADIKEIITPSDKKEKQKQKEERKKNRTPEQQIKDHIKKEDIISYIEKNNPNGISEYNNIKNDEHFSIINWFLKNYPNYIKEKLKEFQK